MLPVVCDVCSSAHVHQPSRLQSREALDLARRIVVRHLFSDVCVSIYPWQDPTRNTDLHVESGAAVAQVFGGEDRTLLSDQQRGTVRVAADVVGTDRQIRNLETFHSVNVETLVKDTVLDNAVALLWTY